MLLPFQLMLKKYNKILHILLIISILSSKTFAQGIGNSPYSAIGVGEVIQNGFVNNYAMGGAGVSFSNGISINSINPALLVKNRYTTFDVGLLGNAKTISTTQQSQKDFGMSLGYLAASFPIRPRWTAGISFKPYSVIDNESRYNEAIKGSGTDTVRYTYKGLGGVSKVSFTNGFLVGKSLYLGIEGNYYFGSIQRDTTTQLLFGDGQDYYLRYRDNISFSGASLKLGIVYQQKLSKKWNFNIGAAYEMQSTLKGKGIRSFSTLVQGANGPTLIKTPDTLSLSRGSLTLPDKLTIGFSLESPLKWIFSADYTIQSWSKFVGFNGKSDKNLTDSRTLSLGVEYIPKFNSTKYLENLTFRAGFQSSETPFTVYGTQISDNHFSFGTSLPLGKRSLNFANLSVVFGKRGTTAGNLIQENYTKIVFGITINDVWFRKIRID